MTSPYMQFYPADYLADTMHLTLEEHGAYLKLLMCMWRSDGWLPDDDKKIALILSCTPKKWASIKANILPFFTYENGKFSQKRLLAELHATQKKHGNLSSNGKLGGRPKGLKNNNSPKADGLADEKQNESIARSPSDSEPEPYTASELDKSNSSAAARARTDFEKIFTVITDAFPDLTVKDSSAIRQWLALPGADPGTICEAVSERCRALLAESRKPHAFSYFSGAVRDAVAERQKAREQRSVIDAAILAAKQKTWKPGPGESAADNPWLPENKHKLEEFYASQH